MGGTQGMAWQFLSADRVHIWGKLQNQNKLREHTEAFFKHFLFSRNHSLYLRCFACKGMNPSHWSEFFASVSFHWLTPAYQHDCCSLPSVDSPSQELTSWVRGVVCLLKVLDCIMDVHSLRCAKLWIAWILRVGGRKKLLFKYPKGEACLFQVTPFSGSPGLGHRQCLEKGFLALKSCWPSVIFLTNSFSDIRKRHHIFCPVEFMVYIRDRHYPYPRIIWLQTWSSTMKAKSGNGNQELSGKAALRRWHSSWGLRLD